MAHVRYTAIRWAREVPTLLHRGRVDRLGHHLLLLLATYSRNDGSDAFMSVTTLAKEAHAPERDVVDALGRLEAAGLIERAHASNGAPGWSLRLDARFEVDSVVADRTRRRRAADRTRQKRRRELLARSGHATVDRDVTHESGVSHGEVGRDKADVTHKSAVSHASMTVTTAGQNGCNSLELPKELTPKDELPADADASGASEPALLDVEPVSRPKKTRKTKPADPIESQAQELASRYYEAMAKMVSFMGVKQVVKTALLSHFSYEQVRAGLDHMSTVDRERPLTRQTLLRAIESPTGRRSGHQPYRDPLDQSAYDEPLLGRTP